MRTCILILGIGLLAGGCSHEQTSTAEQADADRTAADALRRHQDALPAGQAPQSSGSQAAAGLLR